MRTDALPAGRVGLGDVRAQIDENLAAQHAVPARKSLLSRCR